MKTHDLYWETFQLAAAVEPAAGQKTKFLIQSHLVQDLLILHLVIHLP